MILPFLVGIDAVVTDPPYGVMLGDTKNGQALAKRQQPYTKFKDTPEYVKDVCVKAINQCIVKFERVVITPGLRCAFDYPKPDDIGAWFIPAACSRTKWGFATSQPILYYGKSPRAGKGDSPTGVSMTIVAGNINHPCPKPEKFMQWMVNKATLKGETVLDPFMGSGTTGIACVNTKRQFVGIELEEKYFDIACERIRKAYQNRPRLFEQIEKQKQEQKPAAKQMELI